MLYSFTTKEFISLQLFTTYDIDFSVIWLFIMVFNFFKQQSHSPDYEDLYAELASVMDKRKVHFYPFLCIVLENSILLGR